MARLCEARHFYFKMKRLSFFFAVLSALVVCSCNNSPKVRTYQDAENEFLASLTKADSLKVLALGDEFMRNLMAGGDLDSVLTSLTMVENNVLYRISDESVYEMKARFLARPVADFACLRYSFSTEANNDLVYRYTTSGKVGTAPGMKLVFNPVKVEGNWYLTLKDGYQSSKDVSPEEQTHPMSPAPDPVRLNRKSFN